MAKIIEPGRVCIKLAGRDAGKPVVITKIIDDKTVMILSGERRKGQKERKCSIRHLEPTPHKIDPSNKKEVATALGIETKV